MPAEARERSTVPTLLASPLWFGVDLDCKVVLCTRTKDLFHVYVIAWPPQKLATGHMAKDRGARVGYSRKDAFGQVQDAPDIVIGDKWRNPVRFGEFDFLDPPLGCPFPDSSEQMRSQREALSPLATPVFGRWRWMAGGHLCA
jgi:hypothetical protein